MIYVLIGVPLMLSAIVIEAVYLLWAGYALAQLWQWFVVPGLGAAPLSYLHATGLMLVSVVLTKQRVPSGPKDRNKWWEPLLTMFLRPAVALLMGWIMLWWYS